MLWFSIRFADEVRVRHWVYCRGLLDESVEELSAALRFSTIEPERELVEVVIEMFVADSTLVGPQKPALKQGGNTMDLGMSSLSRVIGMFDGGDLVKVPQRLESCIASPAVGVDDRSRLDAGPDEPLEVGCGSAGDPLHPDPADAGAVFFGGNDNKAFARRSSATHTAPAFGLVTAHLRFVDLDSSRKTLSPRTDHGSPQLVQPRLSGVN